MKRALKPLSSFGFTKNHDRPGPSSSFNEVKSSQANIDEEVKAKTQTSHARPKSKKKVVDLTEEDGDSIEEVVVEPVKKVRLNGQHKGKPRSQSLNTKSLNSPGTSPLDAPGTSEWTQKFAPSDISELCVHKAKVLAVRNWLEQNLKPRLLLLSGRTGIGKSTTLRVLAKELKFDYVEYDPIVPFEEWLFSAARFTSLQASNQPSLMVVEELPLMNAGSKQLESFQSALTGYLSSSLKTPLVLIFTDTGSRGTDELHFRETVVEMRQVVPRHILDHPHCTVIEFNPVAMTFLKKAAKRICEKSEMVISPSVLEQVCTSCAGDIRTVVNTLQYMQESGGAQSDLMSCHKEQSLILFHAIGRVLYNKRYGDPDELPEPKRSENQLPPHLMQFFRRQSLVNIDLLFADLPVDISTFSLYLHQNSPSFCTSFDQNLNIAQMYSDFDLMSHGLDEWQHQRQMTQTVLHTLIRSILMYLPSPVPRLGQKLVKSVWFDHSKKQRENQATMDHARLGHDQVMGLMECWERISLQAQQALISPRQYARPTNDQLRVVTMKFFKEGRDRLSFLNPNDMAESEEEDELPQPLQTLDLSVKIFDNERAEISGDEIEEY